MRERLDLGFLKTEASTFNRMFPCLFLLQIQIGRHKLKVYLSLNRGEN